MQPHSDHDEDRFPTDPSGLPEAGQSALVELADGDTLDLRVGPVAKRLGEDRVRMLGYNGTIPGPTLKVPQGSEIVVHVTNRGDLDTTVHWHGCDWKTASRMRGCTGTTRTSARTTPRSWACTATSWSPPPSRSIGRRSTVSWC